MSLEDMARVLRQIKPLTNERVLVGLNTMDDAGVYELSEKRALVQTVDVFAPIVDDPYVFGQIVSANCLSDVYAMGGTPIMGFNILSYPEKLLNPLIVADMLRGAQNKAAEAGIPLQASYCAWSACRLFRSGRNPQSARTDSRSPHRRTHSAYRNHH